MSEPEVEFDEPPLTGATPMRPMSVGTLITNLTTFADFYEQATALIDSADVSEGPRALSNRDIPADRMRRAFLATLDIDRVRGYVLSRYGDELTIGTARRFLGDLIGGRSLSANDAGALHLGAAMDLLDSTPTVGDTSAESVRRHLNPEYSLAFFDQELAKVSTDHVRGLDPELAEVSRATCEGIRECTRLIAAVPSLWKNEMEYCRLAAGVHRAAAAATVAYGAVDIRLRRAGGPNAVLEALNHVLTVQTRAPLDPNTIVGGLNAVLVLLHTNRLGLFPRVDGKAIVDRMLDQLAVVTPPEPKVSKPKPGGKRKGTSADEAEILVGNWLAVHAKGDPASITRDGVALATGVSKGGVSKTKIWIAFQAKRDAVFKPAPREVPLTDSMRVSIRAKSNSEELEAVINEQADVIASEVRRQGKNSRRQERRHDPS